MPDEINYFEARPFRRFIERETDAIAQRHGFRRLKAGIHVLDRDGVVLGDFRIPYTISSITTLKSTAIDPRVGVFHVELARVKDAIFGHKASWQAPQVQYTLMHLPPPPWNEYRVNVGHDNKEVFAKIEHDLVVYGLPWIESRASLKAIIEDTAPKLPSPEGYWYSYLVALGLDNQLVLLKERLEYQDAFCRQSTIPGYQSYREFLLNVAKYFGLRLDHPE